MMYHGRGRGGHMMGEREKAKITDIKRKDLVFVWKYVKKHARHVILTAVLTILMSLIAIANPLISQILIDHYIAPKPPLLPDADGIVRWSIILIVLHGLRWVISSLHSRVATRASQGVMFDLRKDVYTRILKQSMKFNTQRKKGMLASLVTNDVNSISDVFTSGLVSIASNLITVIGTLVVMFMMNVILTLTTLVVLPILLLIFRLMGRKIRKMFLEVRKKIAMLNASVEENFAGIRVVKALNVEKRKTMDFSDLSQVNFQTTMRATVLIALMTTIISINTFITIALLIGIGAWLFINGMTTLGVLIAFFQYSLMFFGPVQSLMGLYNQFQVAAASLDHIAEYMRFPVEVPDPESPVPLPDPVQGRVELKNVTFNYGRGPLMEGLNLEIQPGEKVGIVGETGAGKSTLINLVTRLYDVMEGGVYIDGIDVKDVLQKDLRSNFAVVSQEVMIFSDTIRNNIRFGRPRATDAEVEAAAKLANSHEFIMNQPNGYDTRLGERGTGISGGQKQLIAYSRMILAKPRIVILDEATSNIDSYTEDLIQKNMRKVLENCTSIVIAHRFATLKSMDRLVLMKNGKIIDSGTHDELLERDDYYKELFEKQYSKI
ncbi:MAG: ABC transporter ATP-binding protein [Candidatus Hodarchaeota archaeon]